jgi:hypothetical protein
VRRGQVGVALLVMAVVGMAIGFGAGVGAATGGCW